MEITNILFKALPFLACVCAAIIGVMFLLSFLLAAVMHGAA